jgi:hypothetical protein
VIRFLRRRTLRVPTIWGWLVLLLLGAGALLAAALGLHPFLATSEPVHARLLVVEGWLAPAALEQALETFRDGKYERVVTTGGPIDSAPEFCPYATWAQRAGAWFQQRGVADAAVAVVDAPASRQDRTFLSAVMVREWAKRENPDLKSIDVFSSGAHSRRTRLLYRMAFGPEVAVGIHAARPDNYDPARWWKSSLGAEAVLAETLKLAWTKCFFWPGPPGSHDELWAVPLEREQREKSKRGR